MNPYRALFKALNDGGIRYIVVGGVAVNLHGYSRFTGDVDVLLALDAANLDSTAALIERLGYARRLPIDVRSLADHQQVQTWMTEKGMTAYTFINPSLPQFSLDILAGESVDFSRYDRNKVVIQAWDVPIPVVSLDDLIEMKKKVDREKDAECRGSATLEIPMKPKRTGRPPVDRDYLRRSKRSTPEQKLRWLAAARELVIATRKK